MVWWFGSEISRFQRSSVQKLNFQRPHAKFQRPEINFQRPDAKFQRPEINFQRPDTKFQRPDANFQRPEINFQRPDAKFQRPEIKFPASAREIPDFRTLEFRVRTLELRDSTVRRRFGDVSSFGSFAAFGSFGFGRSAARQLRSSAVPLPTK